MSRCSLFFVQFVYIVQLQVTEHQQLQHWLMLEYVNTLLPLQPHYPNTISPNIKLIIKLRLNKRYINLSISNKIAALIPDINNKAKFYNIIIYNSTAEGYLNKFFIISPKNPIYMALLYPLLFSHNIIGQYYQRHFYIDPKSGRIYKALIM